MRYNQVLDEKGMDMVSACAVTSLMEYDSNPAFFEQMFARKLREQIADHIAHEAVKVTTTQHTKEFRMDLYVVSPEKLHYLIERRAQALKDGAPPHFIY